MRHFIDFSDLSMAEWEDLYKSFENIIEHPADYKDAARGRALGSLFYEPSTRTSFSFQSAMLRLGGGVFSMNDPNFTSVSKGESFKDTIIMCSSYADIITIRHPCEGAALAASLYSRVPIINAGDGGHLHPTQALTDLTTITRLRGKVSDLCLGICGDLKHGRTVHSLLRALSSFQNCFFYLISPEELVIPDYIREYLRSHGQRYTEVTDLEGTLPQLDVLYMTRIQRERFKDPFEYNRLKGTYVLTPRKLSAAKKDLLILHPLPRVDEIDISVDNDPRAAYFEQARLGMYVRMALLLRMLEQLPRELAAPHAAHQAAPCQNTNCITARESYLPSLANNGFCLYCDKRI